MFNLYIIREKFLFCDKNNLNKFHHLTDIKTYINNILENNTT